MTERPPLAGALNARLSVMMFLQYAIWGAWLPLFWSFLTENRGFTGEQTGNLFSIAAIGAVFAPFIAGQIADRWFNTERFLAFSHIAGGILVWQLARVTTYREFIVFGLLYSLIYAPTLPLTNSLAFHHLPDRDRDFGKVRVWGTVGWIAVGIGIGQWLLSVHTPMDHETTVRHAQVAGMGDAFRLSAILGVVQGLYCLTLPATPPQPGRVKFAPLAALGEIRRQPLLSLFLVAFPIACMHQFYFVHTESFLSKKLEDHPLGASITSVFGVGGGLMTIGQMAEIAVLAFMPVAAKKVGRKGLLTVGLLAYIARFAVFAFLPTPAFVVPALALHGLVFGCFFFVCFMVVDENTSTDVRASAQGLFNLVIIAFGTIVGNLVAARIATWAAGDYSKLFAVPMAVCAACLVLFLLIYPSKKPQEAV